MAEKNPQNNTKTKFAVIQTGGKQYVVAAGESIHIEVLPGDYKVGDKITFSEVLMIDDGSTSNIGAPLVKGAKVLGTLEKIARNKTIEVVKYKQKSRYFKRYGHRQPYFSVKIESIQ
jgi:large subunit ribosomal protein L21